MEEKEILRMFHEMALALQCIHQHKILHRYRRDIHKTPLLFKQFLCLRYLFQTGHAQITISRKFYSPWIYFSIHAPSETHKLLRLDDNKSSASCQQA